MASSTDSPTPALSVERIVDAACQLIERDGLRGLSMRKLGAHLGVDPMAVYHHVASKRELLALVTERTVGGMVPPDPSDPWDVRVRQWATGYWELAVANREPTLAGLADADVAAGGFPFTEPLFTAIAESGLPDELVEPTAFIVVDAVHGAALGVGSAGRDGIDDVAGLRAAFGVGLDTIVAGIVARAEASR